MKTMLKLSALKSYAGKFIPLSFILFLSISKSFVFGQTGSLSSPFTSLGQAQNVTVAGVYYFNLTGTTFSTYVISGGWVQVAVDFGDGIGNLPQGSSLTNTARGILNTTVLSKLGSANVVKITSNSNSFSIVSSNATHITRLVNNQCLHTGTNDNGLQGSWSGSTGSLGSGCNSNSDNGLHQRIYHAACNGNGFHWVPKDNNQSLNLSWGELPSSSYLQLWVQAPMVAVINGPVINTQPSSAIQNLCLNSASTALSVAATGTGTITYQWYSNASPSNSGGTLISGATSSSYSPPTTVAGTKYYYVVATNPQGSTTSAVSGAITVSATSVGGTASSNQTICSGAQPANITLSGNTGSIQWQVSSDNISFSNISGATAATLTSAQMGALNATRYYRAMVTSGACSSVYSTVVAITVTPLPTISATTPGSLCGTGSIAIGATAASGVLNWYAAASGGASLGTGTSFSTPSISTTTTYYVDVTLNGCTSPRSSVIATINTLPLAASNAPSSISLEVLAVGAGGGGGGGDGPLGAGGGSGSAVTTSFVVSSGNYTVSIGGGGIGGTGCVANGGAGVGGANGGGNGGNAGGSGCSGGGGGGGGWSGVKLGATTYIIAGGGSGGGGSNEGSANNVDSPGGNSSPNGNTGTNTGGNGSNYSGDGGGGGGGGGGYLGGNGQTNLTGSGQASGGSSYVNPSNTANSIINGNSGKSQPNGSAGGASVSATNATNFGYSNNMGAGAAGGSNNGVSNNGTAGIVIIRYVGTPLATGGTITQSGGYTIHTFTSSGTFAFSGSASSASVPNVTSCGASAVTFTGTVSAGLTLDWYDAATGGNLLSQGTTTFTTPVISTTTTYYVAVRNSSTGCVSATRLAVTATINSVSTVTPNQTICMGATPANIAVTSASGTIQWQSSTNNSTFTNISGQTGSTLTGATMGALNSTMYYRAVITNGACVGNSTVITITVTTLPTITSTTPASICGSGTTVLGANAASGTINWYTAASGGSSLIAGTSYTTPSISATTTYYVDVTANGCSSSPRTAVVATVNALPAAASNTSGAVEYLVVGGGGGGGFDGAGGGGGGQVSSGTIALASGTYAVSIGNGGANATSVGSQATNGGTTTLSTPTAIVSIGGGGGGSKLANGASAANGGGGGHNASTVQTGGTSTVGGGFAGGAGSTEGGGGGGGAAAAGIAGTAGNGGNGVSNSITGTLTYYGGGGGGGSYSGNGTGLAGLGGAGRGGLGTTTIATAGTANTGGGGGGAGEAGSNPGRAGGSGVVIVKYAGAQNGTGGVITSVGGFTIHTFNSNGSFVYTGVASSAVVPNMTACGTSAVTFTGTVSAGLTLDWYDASTGGTLLSQGTTSYTTPVISTTTTYYVAVRNVSTGCVSATRLAVTATINSASTVTANQAICMGATPSNITVTSASGTIQWQSSTNNSTFTNISGQTGATLTGATIGALYTTMYYRAVITNGACVGNSPVHTVTVSTPTISSTPVSTDLVWTGKVSTDWTNASNWLSYNGTNYGLAAAIPTNTTNVFIQGTNACVLNQPTITAVTGLVKNITIETGATLTMTTGELIVKGNWVKNGTFTAGTGMVTFNGTTAQSISGSSGTLFANLTVNNTSTGLTLNTPVTAKFALTMTAGNITTSTTNILLLGFTVVGTLNWTSGTIVGPFRRYYANATNSGNSSGLFPVGTASDNRSALLEYTTAPTSAGYLTVQFKAINPTTTSAGTNGLTLTDQYNWQLDNIATDGYWEISTGMVGGNYNLTLRPKGFTTIGNTFDVCRIIKSPNTHTTWTLDGVHGTTSGTQSDFTISRTGMSGFSYFAIAYPTAAPLPVELISFQANCIDNKGVALTWSTASEHNSANFTVEKSRDGINWSVLSTLAGAGNSTSILNYEIVDADNANGTIYYRLTQFDFDGASETFNIASVNCGSDNPSQGLKVYPNPSSDEFYIEYNNTTSEEQLELMLSDLNGNTIYLENKNCEKGSNTFQLKNLTVAPGIYFIEVRIGETISRVKHSIR